jgi:hypothetical protein
MKKLKLHKFFIGSLDSKYHTKLISDIKNYEAVIHFIIIDIIIFGTKMGVIYDDDPRWVIIPN